MAMQSSNRAQQTIHKILGILALTAILSAFAACNEPTTMSKQDWRTHIVQVPVPHKGCFTAAYPTLQWQTVACVAPPPPNVHYDPAPASGGPGAANVGGGALGPANVGSTSGDYAALVPASTDFISSATGSFPTVTGVTKETDSISGVSDAYTLQLNTNNFYTKTSIAPVCPTAPANTPCRAFQQFIFNNTNGNVFMEYFLSIPNTLYTSCPSGWGLVGSPFPGYTTCTGFSPMSVHLGSQPITNLQSLSLTGTATAGGNDTVYMGTASNMAAMNTDSVLNLGSTTPQYGWVAAEFNVFGACCQSTANFNPGVTINVETTIHYGGTAAPTCFMHSYSGESNSLNLVGAPSLGTLKSPSIEFTESNTLSGSPACAYAAGTGDTHLRTFSGLFYDFQATGDFLLAQAQDFTVQTRQVSGAPTWPKAAINQAVATQMGHTRVAVCAAPPVPGAAERGQLVVDGKHIDLADGQVLVLPSGVRIVRTGNIYLVTDPSGNSMRAVLHSTTTTDWIDVSVGLGTWPTPVRGLLANPNGNLSELAASDGTVFTTPISFADLYGHYGESWRLPPADSLLAHCGGAATENSVPSQPFFARDLAAQAPDIYNHARATCSNAGVKVLALLDACTLDVAVIGSDEAATVYVGAPAPAAVGEAGQAPPD